MRWDYAFYQMLLETGSLSYRNGNRCRRCEAEPKQFCRPRSHGARRAGESFKDITTGVRAHLQHLLLYAGERVDQPVAERTRKMQEWGVLTDWHQGFTRPVTFGDLAAKWAPGTRSYRRMIEGIAERFEAFCAKPDPRPELSRRLRQQENAPWPTPSRRKRSPNAQPVPNWRNAPSPPARWKATSNARRSACSQPRRQAATSATTPFRLLNAPGAETIKEVRASCRRRWRQRQARAQRQGRQRDRRGNSPAKVAAQSGKAEKAGSADKGLQTASTAAAAKSLVVPRQQPQPPRNVASGRQAMAARRR